MGTLFAVPMLHPANLFHGNRRWRGLMEHAFSRAAGLARGTWRARWNDDNYCLRPTLEDVRAFCRASKGKRVSFDIETDGRHPLICDIRCIGLYNGQRGICIPFLHRDGSTEEVERVSAKGRVTKRTVRRWVKFYAPDVEKAILKELQGLLGDKTTDVCTQNGQFDRLCVQARQGLRVVPGFDTMIAHHVIASFLSHGLAMLTSLYTDMPYYKTTEEGDAWSSETDEELWVYCLRGDVPVVMADGSRRRICDLVRSRSTEKVLSYNETTGRMEPRAITGWHRNRVSGQKWIRLATSAHKDFRGIILTPDHRVLVRRQDGVHRWTQAKDVRQGDSLLLPERRLNRDRLNAILGTLMGDSSLIVSPSYRDQYGEAPTAGVQGRHRKDTQLAQEKVRLLGKVARLGNSYPGGEVVVDGRRGVGAESIEWRVSNLAQLAKYLPLLKDKQGRRRLPLSVVQEMGPVGWAWWFMDDGCVQKGQRRTRNTGTRGGRTHARDTVCLATQCFPMVDLKRVVRWMKQRFGATTVGKDKVIRLGVRASEKFCSEIARYVLPKQRYKLPREYTWEPYRDFETSDTAQPVEMEIYVAEEWDPPRGNGSYDLLAETRFCIDVEDNHNFFTPFGLVHNCIRDCKVTWVASYKIESELQERPQDSVIYAHDRRMEIHCQGWKERGMLVDQRAQGQLQMLYRGRAEEALRRLREVVGASIKGDALEELLATFKHYEEDPDTGILRPVLRPRSLPELRRTLDALRIPLTALTDTGEISTAKDYLLEARMELLEQRVRPDDPRIAFLDYLFAFRENDKIEGTFLHPEILPDGRLHPTFSVHVPPTGRLSSQDPNFQNQPKEIRGIFVAAPGKKLVAGDWDSGELRLGGLLSGEPILLKAFDDYDFHGGPKIHKINAYSIFKVDEKTLTDPIYRAAKAFIYGAFYGAGVKTSYEACQKEMPDLLFSDFKRIYEHTVRTYHVFFGWQRELVKRTSRLGYMDSPILERRRYYFEAAGEDSPEAAAMMNMPFQSGLADVVGLANFYIIDQLEKKYRKRGWSVEEAQLAQVHDELLFEVPEKDAEEFAADFKRVGEASTRRFRPKWHMPIEVKVSQRWAPLPWERKKDEDEAKWQARLRREYPPELLKQIMNVA